MIKITKDSEKQVHANLIFHVQKFVLVLISMYLYLVSSAVSMSLSPTSG